MARAIENRAVRDALSFTLGYEPHGMSIRQGEIVSNLRALDVFLSKDNKQNPHRYRRMAAIDSEPTLPERLIAEFSERIGNLMMRNQSFNAGEAAALAHIMTADFVFGNRERYMDICNGDGDIIVECMPKPEMINAALVNLIRGEEALADRRDFTGSIILQNLLKRPLDLDIPPDAQLPHYF